MFKRKKKKQEDIITIESSETQEVEKEKDTTAESTSDTSTETEDEENTDNTLFKKVPWYRNQAKVGMVLIIISVIALVVVAPTVNYLTKQETATVVVAKEGITKSPNSLTEDMFSTAEVPENTLLPIHVKDINSVIGKYAKSDIAPGELVTSIKLSDTLPYENDYLYNLPQGKKAISVELTGMASSISGKLQNGDIVSTYFYFDYEESEQDRATEFSAELCPELTYVKVLSVTNNDGYDIYDYNKEELEETIPSTVTLLVNDVQAEILVGLQTNANIHFALVARGDENICNAYLDKQDEIIAQAKEEKIKEAAAKPLVSIVEEETNE